MRSIRHLAQRGSHTLKEKQVTLKYEIEAAYCYKIKASSSSGAALLVNPSQESQFCPKIAWYSAAGKSQAASLAHAHQLPPIATLVASLPILEQTVARFHKNRLRCILQTLRMLEISTSSCTDHFLLLLFT